MFLINSPFLPAVPVT